MTLRRLIVVNLLASLLIALLVGLVVAVVVKTTVNDTERALCHRQNVHRNADNVDAFANWQVNVLFAHALAHPPRTTLPQTPEQKRVTAKFLALLNHDVSIQTWTPLTHCESPGSGFVPIRFVVRQPRLSDLVLRSGE